MLDIKQIESFYPEHLRPFKRSLLREYLQFKMLDLIFTTKYGWHLSFMGGTAIHLLHANDRFSEDLDFDNKGLSADDFQKLTDLVRKRLVSEGYVIEVKNTFKGAYSASIKIGDLLFKNTLPSHREEKILIKIDSEPQNYSYEPDKPILNKFDIFTRINAVPPGTLLAQKIYAVFMRKRPMGRDFYDAIFLFGKTKPDFGYLKVKLDIADMPTLKDRLIDKCAKLDFQGLSKDVEPLLFDRHNAKKITLFPEYVKSL